MEQTARRNTFRPIDYLFSFHIICNVKLNNGKAKVKILILSFQNYITVNIEFIVQCPGNINCNIPLAIKVFANPGGTGIK